MPTKPLTAPQTRVLAAVADGQLARSERAFHEGKTYLDGRNVSASLSRLRENGYVRLGQQVGVERPWIITDAGRAALTAKETSR